LDERFKRDTVRAVHDEVLARALDRATRRQDNDRKAIIGELGDPWAVRALAGECRDFALDRLDDRLVQLADKIREHGGHVHWALDAGQACRIVADIASQAGCKLAIKTKSMMCEEIRLNPYLEERGLEVVETDLGEYILQLADEPPSHILGPACHKTAGQVAELFNEKLGVPYTEDAGTLARSARGILREKFYQADMGITGANFGVAQTGTIVTVTNEGNGRFVASRPRVLVTVMGMEKVIDSMGDLAVMLKVLGRSATGQRISVYTNLTTGPRQPGDEDGPEAFHLVIVDNGRSRVLASRYRQLLRCIRCGACLNACPVYRKLGGHAYSSIYPGPIGKLLTPLLEGLVNRADLPQVSALCDACRDACPVRIELPEMLILMRDDLRQLGKIPLSQRLGFGAWATIMTHPRLYRWAGRLARLGLALESQGGWVGRIPPAGSPWTDVRDLPLPAERPFHQIWREALKHAPAPTSATGGRDLPTLMDRSPDKAPHGGVERSPHNEPVSADPWRRGSFPVTPPDEVACTQEAFIARVRDALRTVPRDRPRPDPDRARLQPIGSDLLEMFKRRSAGLKVGVHEAAGPEEAVAAVASVVRDLGATRAVATDEGLVDLASLERHLSAVACGLTVVREGAGLEPSFEADVGITGAQLGIAETGSVVLSSGASRRRLVGLAPPAHIVLLPTDRIVADLLDWARRYEVRPLRACQTLISGPSKTADIELTLVTGMHAPGVVHVVLIEQA